MKRIAMLLGMILLMTGCSDAVTVQDQVYDDPVEMEQDNEVTDTETVSESEEAPMAEYRLISPEEAFEMMNGDVLILDVRTQEEYDSGHIQDAVLLPVDDILNGNLEMLPDLNQTILVYCRSGNRSGTASRALVEAGYTGIYDFGGINDWPYDIVQ